MNVNAGAVRVQAGGSARRRGSMSFHYSPAHTSLARASDVTEGSGLNPPQRQRFTIIVRPPRTYYSCEMDHFQTTLSQL